MYSYEIQRLLEKYNYNIPSNEYYNILNNSNQIDFIEYNACNDSYFIHTKDGYEWRFKVFKN